MDDTRLLLDHINELHTMSLGMLRIRKHLQLDVEDVVAWCKAKVQLAHAVIVRKGKNWYIHIDGCVITVNAYSYTIITAHIEKELDIFKNIKISLVK